MEPSSNFTLEVTKSFQADSEQLFKAWTEFEALKQWWKPLNSALSDLVNELHAGGKVKYTFTRTDNSETYSIEGEYSEVVPNQKLIYSWNWNLPEAEESANRYILTIEFNKSGEGSTLTVKQEGFADEEAAKPHREGWENALDSLDSYLGSDNNSSKVNSDAETAGWNEAPEQQKVAE